MSRIVLRVWVPDEPGALGRVATALGDVGGDLIGIEILERGGGSAIDELDVLAPDDLSLDQLIAAVRSVNGVAVEDARLVDADRTGRSLSPLDIAAKIAAADDPVASLCALTATFAEADVAVVVDAAGMVEHRAGPPAETSGAGGAAEAWLAAFVDGSRHLRGGSGDIATMPSDVAWAALGDSGATFVVMRGGRQFHQRERAELQALAAVAAAVAGRSVPLTR